MGYHILVLGGGSGTRLWPLSRSSVPKHFLPLGSAGRSLLRDTVERVLPLAESVHVVTAASQAEACRRELQGLPLPEPPVIAEPQARGTGPALGLATAWIAAGDPGAVISSVHADSQIEDEPAYRAAVLAAAGWAFSTQGLATVGVAPTHPATGLGYVAIGAPPFDAGGWQAPPGAVADQEVRATAAAIPAAPAAGFVEKPELEVARAFVEGGRHLWNTGLFAWPASVFTEELRAADPLLAARLEEVVAARRSGDEGTAASIYAGLETVPVDTLVFERTRRLTVVRGGFSWADVGSFADLRQARLQAGAGDPQGNVLEGEVVVVDSRDSFVLARGGRMVAVVGMSGVAVVDSGDALLVVPLDQAQRVKDVTTRLRDQGHPELL